MWVRNLAIAMLVWILGSVATAGLGASPAPGQTAQSTPRPPLSWRIETVDWVSSCFDSNASLALADDGTPHVSYQDFDDSALMYARRAAAGWEKTVVDDTEHVGRHSSIALDSAGRPHISYRDATNNTLKYAHWDGADWILETVGTIGESGCIRPLLTTFG